MGQSSELTKERCETRERMVEGEDGREEEMEIDFGFDLDASLVAVWLALLRLLNMTFIFNTTPEVLRKAISHSASVRGSFACGHQESG